MCPLVAHLAQSLLSSQRGLLAPAYELLVPGLGLFPASRHLELSVARPHVIPLQETHLEGPIQPPSCGARGLTSVVTRLSGLAS